MPLKKIVSCFALLTFFSFGISWIAVAEDGNATDSEIIQAVPDTDLPEQEEDATQEVAEDCCHTKGVPECGGSCDVCCKTPQHALCVAGNCNANNPFACTCDVTTSCRCK